MMSGMCRLLTWKPSSFLTCMSIQDVSGICVLRYTGPWESPGSWGSWYTQHHSGIIYQEAEWAMFHFLSFPPVCLLLGKRQNRPCQIKRASVGIQRMKTLPKFWLAGQWSETGQPTGNKYEMDREQGNQRMTRNQVHGLCRRSQRG